MAGIEYQYLLGFLHEWLVLYKTAVKKHGKRVMDTAVPIMIIIIAMMLRMMKKKKKMRMMVKMMIVNLHVEMMTLTLTLTLVLLTKLEKFPKKFLLI